MLARLLWERLEWQALAVAVDKRATFIPAVDALQHLSADLVHRLELTALFALNESSELRVAQNQHKKSPHSAKGTEPHKPHRK